MVQLGERPRFLAEHRDHLLVIGERGQHHLDRHLLVGVDVAALEHLAHAAAGEEALHLEDMVEDVADLDPDRVLARHEASAPSPWARRPPPARRALPRPAVGIGCRAPARPAGLVAAARHEDGALLPLLRGLLVLVVAHDFTGSAKERRVGSLAQIAIPVTLSGAPLSSVSAISSSSARSGEPRPISRLISASST